MRTPLYLLLPFLFFALGLENSTTGERDVRPRPFIYVRESKPVSMHGATFIALTEGAWHSTKDLKPSPIEIRLRITNCTDHDLVLPTFDTFFMEIRSLEGRRIDVKAGGRDVTSFTRPLLLSGGAGYEIVRGAKLRWDADHRSAQLDYDDGTGRVCSYASLVAGKYALSFLFGHPKKAGDSDRTFDNFPFWFGEVNTREVEFEILPPGSNRSK